MVVTGLEKLLGAEIDRIAGKTVGLIANPTTVDRALNHAIDRLHARKEIELACLFGPEHGLRASAQDLIEVEDDADPITGLPVRSLYGPTRIPTKEMLDGLDAVIFDIQDVGSRYYTYIWTMAHAMDACARDDIELIVLDRPNPIDGVQRGRQSHRREPSVLRRSLPDPEPARHDVGRARAARER